MTVASHFAPEAVEADNSESADISALRWTKVFNDDPLKRIRFDFQNARLIKKQSVQPETKRGEAAYLSLTKGRPAR